MISKELAQQVYDAHFDLIWTTGIGQVTNVEDFHIYCQKMAANHTSTTLMFMFPMDAHGNIVNQEQIVNLAQYGLDYRAN